MKKAMKALPFLLVLCLVLGISAGIVRYASADHDDRGWVIPDQYGGYQLDANGNRRYVMFWSEAAAQAYMGRIGYQQSQAYDPNTRGVFSSSEQAKQVDTSISKALSTVSADISEPAGTDTGKIDISGPPVSVVAGNDHTTNSVDLSQGVINGDLNLGSGEAIVAVTAGNFWVANRTAGEAGENSGLKIVLGKENMTADDFVNLLKELNLDETALQDLMNDELLNSAGVGGLVVMLTDTPDGIRVHLTSESGNTYQLCGSVILDNGSLIQLGNPADHSDTAQQFGMVQMDPQDPSSVCFFSTVENEALGLFYGEMIVCRYMLIQNEEEGGAPILYWFDETGCPWAIGELTEELDPDGEIRNLFKDLGYENGLPLEADPDTLTGDYLAHTFKLVEIQQYPGCYTTGVELLQCDCGMQVHRILPAAHVPGQAAPEDEIPATCTTGGSYNSVIRCVNCGGVIRSEPVTTSALGHDLVQHEAQAATCTESGCSAYETCRREGCSYSTYSEIPALGHDLVQHAAQVPTCTAPGCSAYETCSREGCTYSTYVEIPAFGHEFVQHEAKAATCTEPGYSAYETCSRDGCTYSTYSEIPALGHAPVQHEAKAATCTESGWNAYETCSRVGCAYSTYSEIPALGHAPVQHEAQAPTCTEPGWDAYESCSRDGCTYSTYSEISALGHDWNTDQDPVWNWTPNEGNTGWISASATFTCRRDSSHTLVLTDDSLDTLTQEGDPPLIYLATVTLNGVTFTSNK